MKKLILLALLFASPVFAQPDGPAPTFQGDVTRADIFDWQQLDDAGKVALIGRIKADWKQKGVNVAMDEQAIIAKMVLGDQANVYESACLAAGVVPGAQPAAPAAAPAGPDIMNADIFDWQMLDSAGKLDLIKRIKAHWEANGVAVPLEPQTIMDKMILGEQANIFEAACDAAAVDCARFRK